MSQYPKWTIITLTKSLGDRHLNREELRLELAKFTSRHALCQQRLEHL